MVKRIIAFISKEIGSLHQAAYLLAVFAFLSQILALVRDRLLAHNFGAGVELDMYYAAFRIPDVIFVTVASLVSISILLPVLVEKLDRSIEDGRRLINSIFTFFFAFILIVSVVIFLVMPWLISFFFQGFTSEQHVEVVLFARILLFSPILLGLSNLLASITQTYKQFFAYALSPVLYNLGIITGILFLAPVFGVLGVVYGVVGGAVLHSAIQVPLVMARGLTPRPTLSVEWPTVWRLVRTALPRTFTLGVHQLSLLALISFASLMMSGSIAVFNLSFNLQSIPLSIIGVSYSIAAFPVLSRMFSRGEMQEFGKRIATAARHIIFWSIPIAVLFIVLRAQIVRTILGSGEFGWIETRLTAAALAVFAVSVVFQGLVLLFVKGYYSAGRTMKPLIINGISGGLIIVFAFVLTTVYQQFDIFRYFIENILRVKDVPGTVILMLPLGYTLGYVLNGILLWIFFHNDFVKISRDLTPALFTTTSSSIIMGFVSYGGLSVFSHVFDITTFLGIFLQGLCAGLLGIAVGVMTLIVLESRELKEVWRTLKRRFWRADAVRDEIV